MQSVSGTTNVRERSNIHLYTTSEKIERSCCSSINHSDRVNSFNDEETTTSTEKEVPQGNEGDRLCPVSTDASIEYPANLRCQWFVRDGIALSVSNALVSAADKPNLTVLLQHLEAEGRLELDAALAIMIRGRELTSREPNMLEIGTPIIIVGDLHGQFYDMVSVSQSLHATFDSCACRSKCSTRAEMSPPIGRDTSEPPSSSTVFSAISSSVTMSIVASSLSKWSSTYGPSKSLIQTRSFSFAAIMNVRPSIDIARRTPSHRISRPQSDRVLHVSSIHWLSRRSMRTLDSKTNAFSSSASSSTKNA